MTITFISITNQGEISDKVIIPYVIVSKL